MALTKMASSPDQDGEPDKPPATEELPVAEKHYPRMLVSNLNPRSSQVSGAGIKFVLSCM